MYPSEAVTFECALNDATLGCKNVTTWTGKDEDDTLEVLVLNEPGKDCKWLELVWVETWSPGLAMVMVMTDHTV